jgi:hypothetical protein
MQWLAGLVIQGTCGILTNVKDRKGAYYSVITGLYIVDL